MDIEKLNAEILNHKNKSPKTYDDIIKLTIPIYLIHQKMLSSMCSLQEEKYGISNAELDVLASLVLGADSEGTLTPTELYDRLLFSSGGMTKVLKRLEDKAYIVRLDNTKDKRSKLVQITQSGRDLMQKALGEVIQFEKQYFECLDDGEQKELERLLFKMLKHHF